jgi:hypothetical protein
MKHKIHWPIFGPVCISGLFLVGAALGMSIICDWAGIWIDFFLTFGATVLLGAVLYVIQGSFLSTVQEEADRVIENVETQAAALDQRIQTQERRIDTLADEVDRNRAVRHAEEDEGLAAITDEMTHEAVYNALLQAVRKKAISTAFQVPASPDLSQLHISMQPLIRAERGGGGDPVISLTPWMVGQPILAGLLWQPGQDVAALIERLERQLESAHLTPATVFDPTVLFTNLRASLTLANHSLRGDLRRRLQSPLVERINEEWALTEDVLESLNSDAFLSIKEFPSHVAYMASYSSGKSPEFDPPSPPGVEAKTWSLLVEIARATYMRHPRGSFQQLAATSL